MLTQAKSYLAGIITLGFLSLAASLQHWTCPDPLRFVTYVLLAMLAGTLKVRLPGMRGTYSLTFLFVLIGIAEFTRGETVVLACVSMIVQCAWNTVDRPRLIQVAFNVAAVAISVAAAFSMARGFSQNPVVQIVFGAIVYYVINTLLVSGILALEEEKSLVTVWRQWFHWSLRYYLVGVATALVILESSRYFGWMFSLTLLPIMYIEYLFLRLSIRTPQRSID
jgi:hypothetical protein